MPEADLLFDTLVGDNRLVFAGNGLAHPIPPTDFRFLVEQMNLLEDD